MLCDQEFFLEWVNDAMRELRMLIEKLETTNEVDLDAIYNQMSITNEKMLQAYIKCGNPKIIYQIEDMQDLMRVVRQKQDAATMR